MPRIFVFGSNLAGRHGKGAALFARQYRGAIYGQAIGLQGNSYGIPTKGRYFDILPLYVIEKYVANFIVFAEARQNWEFEVTRIGCGLAGYEDWQIAPMFEWAPDNCFLPNGW